MISRREPFAKIAPPIQPCAPGRFGKEELADPASPPAWLRPAALVLGIVWVVACGSYLGIRLGGDSTRYLHYMGLLSSGAFGLTDVFKHLPLYHATYVLMAAFGGAGGFVLVVSAATALLPLCCVEITRAFGGRTMALSGVLALVAVNPELYKWSWYVLTDGLFIITALAVVLIVARSAKGGAVFWSLPLLLYVTTFCRPTGVVLYPGIALFAALALRGARRAFVLTCTAACLAAWLAVGATMETEYRIGDVLHRFLARGEWVVAPPRPAEPLETPFSVDAVRDESIGSICAQYPGYCAAYYAKKATAYIWPVYPWYSARHRFFNAVYFGILILFTAVPGAILAVRSFRRQWSIRNLEPGARGGLILLGVTLAGAVALHTVTHVDPDARLLIAWTPLWACFAMLLTQAAAGSLRRA